jgi:hypothetical protein
MNRIFLILLFSFYSFSTFAIIIRHDVDIKEYIVDPGELPWLARLQPIGMHGSTLLQRNNITKKHYYKDTQSNKAPNHSAIDKHLLY